MEGKACRRPNVVCLVIFVITTILLAPTDSGIVKGSGEYYDMLDVDWWKVGQDELKRTLNVVHRPQHAKNLIFFLGDGMGISTLTAARLYKSEVEKSNLARTSLSWDDFPYTALAKTYNTDHMNADSAGTATAFLCGVKTRYGMLGVNSHAEDCLETKGNEVDSILQHSHEKGKWTGIITTSTVTDASPAALYSHSAKRGWKSDADMEGVEGGCQDIASQLIEDNNFVRVVMAGGRQVFFPETQSDPEYPEDSSKNGKRKDHKDLIQKWKDLQLAKEGTGEDTVKYVTNLTEFNEINTDKVEYLMGLFEPYKMQYESDRTDPEVEVGGEPSLAEMTEAAIKILQRGPEGYFLFVEGGRIDHAHHANKANKALVDTLALDEAVKRAIKMTSEEDTLIVVTADHSHVFTINAPPVGSSIQGLDLKLNGEPSIALDGRPYLSMGYTNGPGYTYHRTNGTLSEEIPGRRNLTEDSKEGKLKDKDYEFDSSYPLVDEDHGSEDVAVYAIGPRQHLFVGTHEQNYIAHALMYALCVGEHSDGCESKNSGNVNSSQSYAIFLSFQIITWSLVKVFT